MSLARSARLGVVGRRSSVIGRKLGSKRVAHPLVEAHQSSPESFDGPRELQSCVRFQNTDPPSNLDLGLELRKRPERIAEEPRELGPPWSARALGDVGCNGHRRPAALSHHAESLISWVLGRGLVDTLAQAHCLGPNPKLAEILHAECLPSPTVQENPLDRLPTTDDRRRIRRRRRRCPGGLA